jgi:N-acyl homoserine lactone hydrolase
MATAAEPRPAKLPLPGGKDGAAVKLVPLLCARMIGPPALFHREEGRLATLKATGLRVPRDQWMEVPIIAFLVEHPTAGPVLIDTGFHPSVAVEPKQAMGRFGGLLFKDVRMEPEQWVSAQLRKRGIEASNVKTVVMTHLHPDHASGISEFPDSTFVLSDAEWDAASHGREIDGYIKRQFDHAFDYRLLDFESPDCDSFASFARAYDIFGDGTVRMVFTPGHTHGHCSVILRLRDREVLIVGDAAYTHRTIEESHLPFKMDDEHRFRRSLGEIQLYIEQTPDALVIPGHDMPAWRKLDSLYE